MKGAVFWSNKPKGIILVRMPWEFCGLIFPLIFCRFFLPIFSLGFTTQYVAYRSLLVLGQGIYQIRFIFLSSASYGSMCSSDLSGVRHQQTREDFYRYLRKEATPKLTVFSLLIVDFDYACSRWIWNGFLSSGFSALGYCRLLSINWYLSALAENRHFKLH